MAENDCVVCGEPVEHATGFQRAVGWLRAVDGKNFRTSERRPEWAHSWCLDVERTVGAEQESLL